MKITKYMHSCLLVETPDRVAIFDPGVMSVEALSGVKLDRLDDIFITHVHHDHFDIGLVKGFVAQFPDVRITSTPEVVAKLEAEGIKATDQPSDGLAFFDSPHEQIHDPTATPQQVGIHYLGQLSHPGDSHSFTETKAILALPMQAPWGSNVRAYNLALELKPQHVLPIHDWHWNDTARQQAYDRCEQLLSAQGIKFHQLKTGQPVTIDL
ncbi:MAG: MBL fold metallo-hydrolase [Patescibacteria group bacterium]